MPLGHSMILSCIDRKDHLRAGPHRVERGIWWPLDGTFMPRLGPRPTFTGTSNGTIIDWEGIVRYCKDGEGRWRGWRRVENLVSAKSEDWTDASWTKSNMTATATRLTAAAGNATVMHAALTKTSRPFVLRVRMYRVTGSGNIDLTLDNGATWTTMTLTGSAQVFSISQTLANPQFGIRVVTSGDVIEADQIQVEDVVGQSNANPGEYVSVGVKDASTYFHGCAVDGVKYFPRQNGNTVASNVVTEADGATLTDMTQKHGWLREGADTNIALYSNAMADAVWAATNITKAADDAVAPDGLSTAALYTASAGNGTVIQDLGTVTNKYYVFSVWLKRKTGTGNIQLTCNNGANWTTVTITSSWKRYYIQGPSATTTPKVGIRIVTNADAVWAWGGQAEGSGTGAYDSAIGYGGAEVNGITGNATVGIPTTSLIPTTGATASRSGEALEITDADGSVFGFDFNASYATSFQVLSGLVAGASSLAGTPSGKPAFWCMTDGAGTDGYKFCNYGGVTSAMAMVAVNNNAEVAAVGMTASPQIGTTPQNYHQHATEDNLYADYRAAGSWSSYGAQDTSCKMRVRLTRFAIGRELDLTMSRQAGCFRNVVVRRSRYPIQSRLSSINHLAKAMFDTYGGAAI